MLSEFTVLVWNTIRNSSVNSLQTFTSPCSFKLVVVFNEQYLLRHACQNTLSSFALKYSNSSSLNAWIAFLSACLMAMQFVTILPLESIIVNRTTPWATNTAPKRGSCNKIVFEIIQFIIPPMFLSLIFYRNTTIRCSYQTLYCHCYNIDQKIPHSHFDKSHYT